MGKALNQTRAQLAPHFSGSTVDGKNPAPVDSRSQVVPYFFHQQYLIFSMLNAPSANPGNKSFAANFLAPISKAPIFKDDNHPIKDIKQSNKQVQNHRESESHSTP